MKKFGEFILSEGFLVFLNAVIAVLFIISAVMALPMTDWTVGNYLVNIGCTIAWVLVAIGRFLMWRRHKKEIVKK